MKLFSSHKTIQALLAYSKQLGDISATCSILSWDQETYMPTKGGPARAEQLATLSGIFHQQISSVEFKKLLSQAKPTTPADRALVREFSKLHKRATKIPEKLVRDMSQSTSQALETWKKAKQTNRFSIFEKDLQRVLQLRIQSAKLLQEKGQTLYDVMLDEFESGLTEAEVERVFSALKPQLKELAVRLAKLTANADEKLGKLTFDRQKQWDFGIKIATDMGYDFAAGRQDKSAHPFTTTFSVGDVRITTWENDDIRPALFATIHEAGHALYEQGVNPELDRLQVGDTGGLGGGTGMAMHESQSRLWENMIGRSSAFWKKYYSKLVSVFPELKSIPQINFVKAVSQVQPSLIRVEADEVTYGLHIMARFEIERDLVAGKIKVHDLPKIWNAKYKDLLGITPPSDTLGVLQDIHWSHGAFGYFPTYLLGSLMGAQLLATAQKKIDIYNMPVLREWLRKNIHQHGRIYSSNELLKKITGESLNPQHYLGYLETKFASLYNTN